MRRRLQGLQVHDPEGWHSRTDTRDCVGASLERVIGGSDSFGVQQQRCSSRSTATRKVLLDDHRVVGVNEVSADDPDPWRADLASMLPGLRGGENAVTLRSAVSEVCDWVQRAPLSAWSNKKNAASLRADVKAGYEVCGARALNLLGSPVAGLLAALLQIESGKTASGQSDLNALNAAVQRADQSLTASSVRAAVWVDIVNAARSETPDPELIYNRIALLNALLDNAGLDPGRAFSKAGKLLFPSTGALIHDVAPADWGNEERIRAAELVMSEEAETGRCVVWLHFIKARIPKFVVELGRVTFFDAEWCIGNALGPPSQDFKYRDELAEVLGHDMDLRNVDDHAPARDEVLVRVDLGDRSPYRAIDDASQRVQAIVGIVANESGAPSWRRGWFRGLLLDGQVSAIVSAVPDRETDRDTDYYGMNGFADAFEHISPRIAGLLATDRVPAELGDVRR